MRYGPNRYSFDDATASKAIYGHGTAFAKSDWYFAWGVPGQWNLFEERDIAKHAQYRRQFQSAYSMSALVEYEPYVDECADLFSQRLEELSRSSSGGDGGGGLPVNMGHWLQCYAFDVIGCITYSKRLGFLDQGRDVGGLITALEHSLVYSTLAGVYSYLYPYLFKLSGLLATATRNEGIGGVGYVVNFTREMIAEHQAAPKALDDDEDGDDNAKVNTSGKARDFLSKFLTRHTQDPNTFTTYHIFQGCGSNMVAGSDTTSISLSATLYYLLKNPACLQKLREEVTKVEHEQEQEQQESEKEITTTTTTTATTTRHITLKQSQEEMPYLQAVIKEGLRLHPATGLPLERIVPPGGATICGRFFPEGVSFFST